MRSPSLRTTVTVEDFQAIRDETEILAAPLSAEDQQVQSMPDVSPTKWHRAHITWFFETFLLLPHLPGYTTPDEQFGYLYNSYYEAIGDRHPRHERGLVSRPTAEEVGGYRAHVDAAMTRLIDEVLPERPELEELVVLGLHHEQQHQELLLMDIKHVFSTNPLRPAYHPSQPAATTPESPMEWVDFEGGLVHMGHEGPTDVLSFPMDSEDDVLDMVDDMPLHLGDIVICPDVAAQQAPEHCGTVDAELSLLIIHGVLHILGHDHVELEETAVMQDRERHHLLSLGIAHPVTA